jgi:hypothetical protein
VLRGSEMDLRHEKRGSSALYYFKMLSALAQDLVRRGGGGGTDPRVTVLNEAPRPWLW